METNFIETVATNICHFFHRLILLIESLMLLILICEAEYPAACCVAPFGGAGFLARRGNRCSYEGVMPRLLAAGIAEARLPKIYFSKLILNPLMSGPLKIPRLGEEIF